MVPHIDNTSGLAGRVAQNTLWIILGNFIHIGIGIVTIASLARYLGSENFGKYSFVFAYLGFFGIVSDFGINTILVRDISRDKTRAGILIANAIIIKLLLSVIAIILACLLIILLKSSAEIITLVSIASLSFFLSFASVYRIIFQVNLKMLYPTVVGIVEALAKLALFAGIIVLRGTLAHFVFAAILCPLTGLLMLMHFSGKIVRPEFKVDFGLWKEIFKESFPLALSAVFIMIYTRIDQVMLFRMKGAAAVGYYSAAVRLAEIFNIIPAAFMASVFPLMSRYFKTSKESLTNVYRLSYKYMMLFIIPLAMGMTLLAKQIILLVYGEDFLPSVIALSIIIWSEVFIFFGTIHYFILISTNIQRLDFLFTGTSAVLNIILNLLFIPTYGIAGASVATVIAYAWGPIFSLFLRISRPYSLAGWRAIGKPLIASCIMGIYMYYTKPHLLTSILVGALVFILVIVCIKGFRREDVDLICTIFQVNKNETE